MPKSSHEAVNYRDGDQNSGYCAACEHYKPPHCSIVVDPIIPEGVCDLYDPRTENASARDALRRGLMSTQSYQKAKAGGY